MNSQKQGGLPESARRVCLVLPGAVEHIDGFGHTTFQINGKSFVRLGGGEKGPSLAFKSDRETQELLLQEEKFFKTPYIGHHGWTSIRNPVEEDWNELSALIQEAYLRTAPKHLVKEWMEHHKK